jgi:hypothetical protein
MAASRPYDLESFVHPGLHDPPLPDSPPVQNITPPTNSDLPESKSPAEADMNEAHAGASKSPDIA